MNENSALYSKTWVARLTKSFNKKHNCITRMFALLSRNDVFILMRHISTLQIATKKCNERKAALVTTCTKVY
jgi:hypothetical protein